MFVRAEIEAECAGDNISHDTANCLMRRSQQMSWLLQMWCRVVRQLGSFMPSRYQRRSLRSHGPPAEWQWRSWVLLTGKLLKRRVRCMPLFLPEVEL